MKKPNPKRIEHPLDRVYRLSKPGTVIITADLENGVWYKQKRPGRQAEYFMENPVTELKTCQLCGKTSTPKKVHYRAGVWGWNIQDKKNWWLYKSKETLCMGCWNKARPISNQEYEANQTRLLINKLTKEIRNERKNQNNRANA